MNRLILLWAVYPFCIGAFASPWEGWQVQPPKISFPDRGSLTGPLARTGYAAADLIQGSFRLPSSISLPTEKGSPLFEILPAYSPDHGMSEWGMGWETRLIIRRCQIVGQVNYRTDDLTGPWGRMIRGGDSAWYPVGLTDQVRVIERHDRLIAFLPDGRRATFGGKVREKVAIQRGASIQFETYAWYLTGIQDLFKHRTVLDWSTFEEWDSDEGPRPRPRLDSVRYGGFEDDFQYRIDLVYMPLPPANRAIDRKSGEATALSSLVNRVKVYALNSSTSKWGLRWTHHFDYEKKEGLASYLVRSQRVFPDSTKQPPIRYEYGSAKVHWENAKSLRVESFDAVLDSAGTSILNPRFGTVFDLEENGMPDLESASDGSAYVRSDTGFVRQSLPPIGDAIGVCRESPNPANESRHLMKFSPSDTTPSVVFIGQGLESPMIICDRAGRLKVPPVNLGADWKLGPNTRLVDINGDLRPDLVRTHPDEIHVRLNFSSDTLIEFAPSIISTIQPIVKNEVSWLLDFTGDGIADLVIQSGIGLWVWPGIGHGNFEREGVYYAFLNSYGSPLVRMLKGIRFLDANNDGLTDVLLTQETKAYLAVNDGRNLVYQHVPALEKVSDVASSPVPVDLVGSGEEEIAILGFQVGKIRTYSIAVTSPSTGLLTWVDDGQGTRINYEYKRAPAMPGIVKRHSVLSKYRIKRGADSTITFEVTYGKPRIHSGGYFQIGYATARLVGPLTVDSVEVVLDDRYSGLVSFSKSRDLLHPSVDRWSKKVFSEAAFESIPFLRLKSERHGRGDSASGMESITQYLKYSDERCPSIIERRAKDKTLTATSVLATISGLDSSLHCIESSGSIKGGHSDPGLDFKYQSQTIRNKNGQIESLINKGPTPLLMQQVKYLENGSLWSLAIPGKGRSIFAFDTWGQQLQSLTTSDGVTTEITRWDPLLGIPLEIAMRNGALEYLQSYQYDSEERLSSSWDNIGISSKSNPDELYRYRTPDFEAPGVTISRKLIGQATARYHAWLSNPDGGNVCEISLSREGWIPGLAKSHDANKRRVDHTLRSTLPFSLDLFKIRYEDLSGRLISSRVQGSMGLRESNEWFHSDVSKRIKIEMSVENGLLRAETIENDSIRWVDCFDAFERPVSRVFPSGARYEFTYDAMDRIRRVRLPDGTEQKWTPDAYGRVASVLRSDGLGVRYSYRGDNGLLAMRTFFGTDERPHRTSRFLYDSVGRVIREIHHDLDSKSTTKFVRHYDGKRPGFPTEKLNGRLTAVSGPGFNKRFWYRADGRIIRDELELIGIKTLRIVYRYHESGDVSGKTVTLLDKNGTLLISHNFESDLDTLGQVSRIKIDGVEAGLAEFTDMGRISGLALKNGDRMTFIRDSLTSEILGAKTVIGSHSFHTSSKYGNRGFMAIESNETQNSPLAYEYTPDGQLRSVRGESEEVYGFDTTGMLNMIRRNGSHWTITKKSESIVAGIHQYVTDRLGRVTGIGGSRIKYGAEGHIRTLHRDGKAFAYVHDEDGRRIAKLEGKEVTAAWYGEFGFDEKSLWCPLQLEGKTIGLWGSGQIGLLPVGARETTRPASSAFGPGARSQAIGKWIDYHGGGYDEDLGTVRFGMRDYDPRLGAFWTPDIPMLEDMDKMQGSPLEANLYSFAKGNPIAFSDPKGNNAMAIFSRMAVSPRSEIGANTKAFLGGVADPSLQLSLIAATTFLPPPVGIPAMVVLGAMDFSGVTGADTRNTNYEKGRDYVLIAAALASISKLTSASGGGRMEVPTDRVRVPKPISGESVLEYGSRIHQNEFERIISETNPGASGKYNVAAGLTGPDLENPAGMNARFVELKSLWGRQAPMLKQAKDWGFDAQSGRYIFYDKNTGFIFEGIIQTEKFPSGKFRQN